MRGDRSFVEFTNGAIADGAIVVLRSSTAENSALKVAKKVLVAPKRRKAVVKAIYQGEVVRPKEQQSAIEATTRNFCVLACNEVFFMQRNSIALTFFAICYCRSLFTAKDWEIQKLIRQHYLPIYAGKGLDKVQAGQ